MSESPDFEVRWIDATDTHDLRERVLRPGHPEDVDFPEDQQASAIHAGAFDDDGRLIAIASMYCAARPGRDARSDKSAWRLRGMAADPGVRRLGAGTAVLDMCLTHVRAQGATIAWCNARTPAIPFYESQGWVTLGDEFEIPSAGPHFVMELAL